MAGFDLDAPAGEPTPPNVLGALTLKTWTEDKLDWAHIEKCRQGRHPALQGRCGPGDGQTGRHDRRRP